MKRSLSKIKFYSVLALLNVLVGAGFYMVYAPRTVEAKPATQPIVATKAIPAALQHRKAVQGIPVRIVISSVGIDLSVAKGSYDPDSATWSLNDTQAFYADISVPANDNNGTTLIYGHATWVVFSRLLEVRKGAEAVIYTHNGHVFRYKYQSREEVEPTDLSLLRVEGPPVLIVQTCSGPWDAYRTMISFKLVSVEKS